MSSLFNYPGRKKLSFLELPTPAKKAIAWRWGVECADTDLSLSIEPIINLAEKPANVTEEDWKEIFDIAGQKLKNIDFFYSEIPTDIVIKTIMECHEDISSDWNSWEEYSKWYTSTDDIPMHGPENRFPCLSPLGDEEIFDDGWHRLHAYVLDKHETIPVLEY